MSTSTVKPRDSVADLLLQLSRNENVTKTQLNDANTYYSSIVAELKSYKDLHEIDPSMMKHDNSYTKTDNGSLHRELERLRKDNIALKKELDNIQKEKQETAKTNAGHQDNASKQREQELESLRTVHSATKQELEHYKDKEKFERQAKNDLEKSVSKQIEECKHFKQELESLRTVHSATKQELEHYKNEEFERQAKTDIEKSVSRQREECEHFKQELESLRTVHSKTKQELEHYKNKEVFERQAKTNIEKSVTKLTEDNESLRRELAKRRTNYNTAKQELEQYKNKERLERKANFDMKHREKIMGQEQGQSKAMEKLRQQNLQLNEEKDRLLDQINELRNRLSVMAGHKLTDGNPGIADFSDPYRPTNLAERFRQLYDDEWTHAFEELEKDFSNREEEVIDILAKIIKDVDHFCDRTSIHQFDNLKHYAKLIILEPCYQPDGKEKPPMTCDYSAKMSKVQEELTDKLLKDFRKSLGILSKTRLVKIFHDVSMSKLMWNNRRIPVLKGLNDFLDRTLELVWMMKIQDPPMEFT